jgi:hypothetical protein
MAEDVANRVKLGLHSTRRNNVAEDQSFCDLQKELDSNHGNAGLMRKALQALDTPASAGTHPGFPASSSQGQGARPVAKQLREEGDKRTSKR